MADKQVRRQIKTFHNGAIARQLEAEEARKRSAVVRELKAAYTVMREYLGEAQRDERDYAAACRSFNEAFDQAFVIGYTPAEVFAVISVWTALDE